MPWSRYPLLSLAVAFLTGVAVARWCPCAGWPLAAGGLLLLGIGWRVRRRTGLRWGVVMAMAFLLGVIRWQADRPPFHDPAFIANYAETSAPVTVSGVLVQPPDLRDTYANLRLRVESLRLPDDGHSQPAKGLLLARVDLEEALSLRYGDRLVLVGRLRTPPESDTFSYRAYLARQGIFVLMRPTRLGRLGRGAGNPLLAAIYALRERGHQVVRRLWPDPEAALLSGILLGLDQAIPAAVYDAFRRTGTAHIIAISGFNISILAALFLRLFGRWLGPWRGGALAAAAIVAYTVMVGADAAVVRAAVMGLVGMLGWQLGRPQHGYTTLAFAAAVMAAFDPQVLGDVGFQLSFAATWGLLRFAAPLEAAATRVLQRWWGEARARRLAAPLGEFFLFTLAAQVTTLPIAAYHFRQISLIAFVANPAILPVQAPLMVGGGAAVLLGLVWLPLGQPLAWAVWPLALYTIRVVEGFARVPWVARPVWGFGLAGVVAYYAALLLIPHGWARVRQWLRAHRHLLSQRWRWALLPAAAVLSLLTWRAAAARPAARLDVVLLPVGNGEALLIRSPTGRVVVADGGSRSSALADGMNRFWGLRLQPDWWVVGATREESTQAPLTVAPAYPPRQVWWAGQAGVSSAARRLRATLEARGLPITAAQVGGALRLGRGARLEVLALGPRGGIFLLRWRRFRLLLPLGADFTSWEQVRARAPALAPLSALLLAESGYAPLNPPEVVRSLQPRLLLLSVQPADPWGRPDLTVLQALAGFPLLRTDRCGWVWLTTDGQRLWVRTQHPCPSALPAGH